MRIKAAYFVVLIFLVMSPQAFSNGKCADSFSSIFEADVKDKQKLRLLLSFPINFFGLSHQTVRILKANNIHLLADLVRLTEAELLQLSDVYNFHKSWLRKKDLEEVKALLSAMDLHLGTAYTIHWSEQKRNELIEAHKSKKALPPILDHPILTQREEKVLKMRFGIGEERPYFFREIAPLFNRSLTSIQRTERIALSKLYRFNRRFQLENIDRFLSKEQIERLIEVLNNIPVISPETTKTTPKANKNKINYQQPPVSFSKEEAEKFLAYPVKSFNFSEKAQETLENAKIFYIGDLVAHTESSLSQLAGLSRQAFKKIKLTLSAMNLRLGMINEFNRLEEQWKKLIEEQESTNAPPPFLAHRIMTEKGRKVLKMLYGFGEEKPYTVKEVAQLLNQSPSSILQIEAHALPKLLVFGRSFGMMASHVRVSIVPYFRNYARHTRYVYNIDTELRAIEKEQIKELIELYDNLPILFPYSK